MMVALLLVSATVPLRSADVKARNLKREDINGHERDVRAGVKRLVGKGVPLAVLMVGVEVRSHVPQLEGGVLVCGRGGREVGGGDADVVEVEGGDWVLGKELEVVV